MAQPTPPYRYAGTPPDVAANPLGAGFTNLIEHNAMMRQQEQVKQYQQVTQQPANMTLSQHRMIANADRFQFGVMGGQNKQLADLRQHYIGRGQGATALTLGADMAAGYGINAGMGALGFGTMASIAVPLAASIPAMMLGERAVERNRWRYNIAKDINTYSKRFTGGRGFDTSDIESGADTLMNEMWSGGDFFDKETQAKIHKMTVSSGMLKGKNIDQYIRNFKDIKENVKDIVKLMNTTVEGGLSIMKELQNVGFSSPGAVKNQIVQARAYGNMTGIGSQNMMSLGASAAQAAQGTGWSRTAAAEGAQTMAAITGFQSSVNPRMASAVKNMGGVANAAMVSNNAFMNMLQSGMGRQTMAYLMDPSTKGLDKDKMEKLMSGDVSASQIVSGANRYGSSGRMGGAYNRATFDRDSLEVMNEMSPVERLMTARHMYGAWSKSRGGENDTTAHVFAKMFTQNMPGANIVASQLTGAIPLTRMRAAQESQRFQLAGAGLDHSRRRPVAKSIGDTFTRIGEEWNSAADTVGRLGQRMMPGLKRVGKFIPDLLMGRPMDIGGWGSMGLDSGYANMERVANEEYGFKRVTREDIDLINFTGIDIAGKEAGEPVNLKEKGINIENILQGKSKSEVQKLMTGMAQVWHGDKERGTSLEGRETLMDLLGVNAFDGSHKAYADRKVFKATYDQLRKANQRNKTWGGTEGIERMVRALKAKGVDQATIDHRVREVDARVRDYGEQLESGAKFSDLTTMESLRPMQRKIVTASLQGSYDIEAPQSLSKIKSTSVKEMRALKEDAFSGKGIDRGWAIWKDKTDLEELSLGEREDVLTKAYKIQKESREKEKGDKAYNIKMQELATEYEVSPGDLRRALRKRGGQIKEFMEAKAKNKARNLSGNVSQYLKEGKKSQGKADEIAMLLAKGDLDPAKLNEYTDYFSKDALEGLVDEQGNVTKKGLENLTTKITAEAAKSSDPAKETYNKLYKTWETKVEDTYKDGVEDAKKSDVEELDKLTSKLADMKALLNDKGVGAGTDSLKDTVNPPVLNYWDSSRTYS